MINLTEVGISKLVTSGETETVEFKSSFNDEALESIGAFANACGGVLLIGVKNSGDVCGFQDGKKSLEDIANRIQVATDPRIQPSISVNTVDKEKILVIQVSKSNGTPVSVRGRYLKRAGRTNQRMSHDEIMRRIAEGNGFSWDRVLIQGATIDDLNMDLVDRFIMRVRQQKRLPIPLEISNEEFLRKCMLIKNGAPTRAAILLFGKRPEEHFSSAFVKLGRFRSLTLIVDDREVHGPLLTQLDEIMGWFRERLETEFVITGKPERDVLWEYPLNALREAVTNILCHRDYSSMVNSTIRLHDNHLEFSNPGGLLSPLTPETLFQEHDSIRRNHLIAEVFFYMGLIERWGSGTIRISDELKSADHPKPEFISEPGRFKAVFYRQPENELERSMLLEKDYSMMGLSERQSRLIAYLQQNQSISSAQYRKIAHTSKRTAIRELNELISKGILITEGESVSKIYLLKGE